MNTAQAWSVIPVSTVGRSGLFVFADAVCLCDLRSSIWPCMDLIASPLLPHSFICHPHLLSFHMHLLCHQLYQLLHFCWLSGCDIGCVGGDWVSVFAYWLPKRDFVSFVALPHYCWELLDDLIFLIIPWNSEPYELFSTAALVPVSRCSHQSPVL